MMQQMIAHSCMRTFGEISFHGIAIPMIQVGVSTKAAKHWVMI